MNSPNLIVLVALVALAMSNNPTISAFSSVAPSLTTAATSTISSSSSSSSSAPAMTKSHTNKSRKTWLCSTTTPAEPEASVAENDDNNNENETDNNNDNDNETDNDNDNDDNDNDDGIIPITVISGFLGSGKTTLLTHLLENKSGDCPVGIVVNDVADVNIDGKLVKAMENGEDSQGGPGSNGLVQLENGCACCALSDELLTSISELVTISDLRRGNSNPNTKHLKPFKHIVVEMSGVSDPRNIRATFQEAEQSGMALMDRTRLDTLVTVVDAEMFETYFASNKRASIEETPELFGVKGGGGVTEEQAELEEWMKDVPQDLLRAILGHNSQAVAEADGVADLLVGQTETADVILLNKCDLLEETKGSEDDNHDDDNDSDNDDNDSSALSTMSKLGRLRELVKALNPRPTTTVLESSYGRVPLESILGVAKGDGVAISGAVDDHREFVQAASAAQVGSASEAVVDSSHDHSHSHDESCADPECTDPTHDHSHSHDHSASSDCADPECTDPTHDHSHSHDHSASSDCADPECTDPTHDHSHSHDHSASSDCADPECTDPTHDHSHSHDHSSECNDPGCTDPSHDHDHSHSHSHSHSHDHEENSTHAGIGTFVYRARRPFHPKRILSFLRTLPIARGLPDEDEDEDAEEDTPFSAGDELVVEDNSREVLRQVLRSKGFVWSADSHSNSMYWSHAGASFEYKCLGQWWATLPRSQWPEGVDEYVLEDFDDRNHPSEGIVGENENENDVPETVGDRRQEVVFIGLGFGQRSKQERIKETLDKCLLTDEEYDEYRSICVLGHGGKPEQEQEQQLPPEVVLQNRFPPVMESEYVNY